MIFEYEELRNCVREDFETFYREMRFTEAQVILAVLNEYEHGEEFTVTEEICIYLFLAEIYKEEGLNTVEVTKKLFELLSEKNIQIVKKDLGDKYLNFNDDLERIK